MKPLYQQTLGRVTVAYIPDEPCPGTIRVVLTETGECLREDKAPEMNDTEWDKVVELYKNLLQCK